ncbi:MAG TPA: DNA methyltransferase [Candidatus Paceibacterota bacterium]|nr:DNA methyltransferase [Candidatus Paceibacterota bacterium]
MQPLAHKTCSAVGADTPELPLDYAPVRKRGPGRPLADELADFREFGQETRTLVSRIPGAAGGLLEVPVFINEFWTAKQRQASSLHEISYRACFKPQLPRFFIERLTQPGETVYDPFMGRGTTVLEAALLGRLPCGCDINPLSLVLTRPRLCPPSLVDVAQRLRQIDFASADEFPEELLVFFHPDTLLAIASLKQYLLARRAANALDAVDDWICLIALNRLTGHSPGFFSVYTLPPNQAVSVKSQRKINADRKQTPPLRDVPGLILKKTRKLLRDCDAATRSVLAELAPHAVLLSQTAAQTPQIAAQSVSLVVTSPPFLNVVDYATDNWLRCWFLGLDARSVRLTVLSKLELWQAAMTEVFQELHRVLKPGGHVAFEVGEVHAGKTRLEEAVLPCGVAVGLDPVLVLINDQQFTKTANCWGVDNMTKGTNSNRIVLFRRS